MEFKGSVATRVSYGKTLERLGGVDPNLVVLDADLSKSTQTVLFAKKYPERFFQMGIAEANMVCVAAGLALAGKKPFVSTFAIFGTGRAWEAIRTIVCRARIPVRFCFSHAGVTVGEDGSSAQAIEDVAVMRVIPYMQVIVPADGIETEQVIEYIAQDSIRDPVYVRLGRNKWPVFHSGDFQFRLGKGELVRPGKDAVLFSYGQTVAIGLQAAEILEKEGIHLAVANLSTLKPLDEEFIFSLSAQTKKVMVLEEHSVIGGLGEAVGRIIASIDGIRLAHVGINDVFGESGTAEELLTKYGLDVPATVQNVHRLVAG